MASAAAAIDQAASAKPVDGSLWWDSFVHLFEELDSAPLSSDLPDHLAKKIKNNHAWFLDSVTRFKAPNEASRLALDSSQISVGSHRLVVKPKLKEAAIRFSSCLCLDEVQSYILVSRSFECNRPDADVEGQDFLHLILLQYYFERQCLLKCIRRIFVHALCMGDESQSADAIMVEALQLVHDGLDRKLLSILTELLSSTNSQKSEVDITVLCLEESVIEDNLILDILFLAYYDNFCSCNCEQWKSLCSIFKEVLSGSYSVGKLAVSLQARASFDYAKFQLLLILVETLDLENLLQMVHDEVPFRQGCSGFSLSDIQEMDALVSSFSTFREAEAGSLVLAWAIFVCLLLSLPDRGDYSILMEIDHIGYLRQAFDSAPLNYLVEILRSDTLRNSDGPVSGYLSVLRTLISAFIASYELNNQTENNTRNLIFDILCEIYHEEDSISIQFWDRDSCVDGPIRSLLYSLESEYPFRTEELVRLLSALCSGAWSAECVYNFLENMSGITVMSEIPNGSRALNPDDVIESHNQLEIPSIEGFVIPRGTRGQILRIIDANVALVRWEVAHSGLLLLLLHWTQKSSSCSYEECSHILNLVYRMVSSSKALSFALLYIEKPLPTHAVQNSGHTHLNLQIDVVMTICVTVFSLMQDVNNAGGVSICISILAELLKCAPCHVTEVVLRSDIFGTTNIDSSSNTWLLSGGLARMLLADSEGNGDCFLLTSSVLDFTIQLVEKGGENSLACSLVVFSLQYVLVNHVHWKYSPKYAHWKMTLKVLEVIKSCINASKVSQKLCSVVRNILFFDSSVHSILCQIVCVSPSALERSYVSYHCDLKEIEGRQLAVCSALDIIYLLMTDLLKFQETFPNAPTFIQMILSSTAKPIPIVAAAVSLINYFQNSVIQVAATKVFSMLCIIASRVRPFTIEKVGFIVDAMQIRDLGATICRILDEESNTNEDLLISVFNLLTYAAHYQPALLVSVLFTEDVNVSLSTSVEIENQHAVPPLIEPSLSKTGSPLDLILKYVKRSEILIKSAPCVLLSVLKLLKALWDGGLQYMHILEKITSSEMFWKHLTSSILSTEAKIDVTVKNLNDYDIQCMTYRYQCQGTVLEIMTRELFLYEKLLQNELAEKQISISSSPDRDGNRLTTKVTKTSDILHPVDILSAWFTDSTMDNLIRSYSSGGYDHGVILHAKVAVSVCIMHLIAKLSTGNAGSLSISLVEKINIISNKLNKHPAFSALLAQYSSHGYSDGKELTNLVVNDLYYHLQGELEGREIAPGPFQELSHFLLELETFQCNEPMYERDITLLATDVMMFDITQVRTELGIDLWDYSDWKTSKEVVEKMLLHMHDANLIISLSDSKQLALTALVAAISVYKGNVAEAKSRLLDNRISKTLIEPNIRYVCKCLQATEDSLIPTLSPPEILLKILTAQTELLLILAFILFRQKLERNNKKQFLSVSLLLMKTSGSVLRFLVDVKTSSANRPTKLLLMLLLTSVEFNYSTVCGKDKSDSDVDQFAEVSLTSVGLLPVLCRYTDYAEYTNLSVASADLLLKGFLAPNSWLPILEKHFQLQHIVRRIQQKDNLVSTDIILKFLLTLAHAKGGAEMLYSANLLSSLKVIFSQLLNGKSFSNDLDGSDFYSIFNNDEKSAQLWKLGLAIITSMIYSLGDDPSCADILDSTMCYFFSEKSYIVSWYLSTPCFLADDQSRKRTRNQKPQTSLTALSLTEHTLTLICVLARHQASWSKGMKEMDSELRETSIHLLAFISRAVQRIGDLPHRTAPIFCPPTLKEEVELHERPSFVNSKHGWFALSAFGLVAKTKVSAASDRGGSLVINNQANGTADLVHQSYFSDTVATQMYRIAFLVLEFLCMQAKAAVNRAEELQFIDLARFPELPMPEILHGIQDQAVSILTEICEANGSKTVQPEREAVCNLLLGILEKSLYLELCVSRSCGIRPVFGRFEDFAKEVKVLTQVLEQHSKFKTSLRSLQQIIALVYPGLLQTGSLS